MCRGHHVVQRVRYMQRHTYVIVTFSLIPQNAKIELVSAKKKNHNICLYRSPRMCLAKLTRIHQHISIPAQNAITTIPIIGIK